MATKRYNLEVKRRERIKARRQVAKRKWAAGMARKRIEEHQAFVLLKKTVAALKLKQKMLQKKMAQ